MTEPAYTEREWRDRWREHCEPGVDACTTCGQPAQLVPRKRSGRVVFECAACATNGDAQTSMHDAGGAPIGATS